LKSEIRTLLISYRGHKDLIDLKAKWPSTISYFGNQTEIRTRLDKLIDALDLMLSKNIINSSKSEELL